MKVSIQQVAKVKQSQSCGDLFITKSEYLSTRKMKPTDLRVDGNNQLQSFTAHKLIKGINFSTSNPNNKYNAQC